MSVQQLQQDQQLGYNFDNPYIIEQPLWFVRLMYPLCTFVSISFGVFACILALRKPASTASLESFITARNSITTLQIIWGVYASNLGAWAVLVPASYNGGIQPMGWVGCITQPLSQMVMTMILCYLGSIIAMKFKNINSFSDFVRRRFGLVAWGVITVVMIINQACNLLLEYVSIASLFQGVVDPQSRLGNPAAYIVTIQGFVVAIYTALGGLEVSVITDVFQGGLSFILLIVYVLYLAARFRYPLLQSQFEQNNLGMRNLYGWNSLCIVLQSIATFTFAESIWQRVWASKSPQSLYTGAFIGSIVFGIFLLITSGTGVISNWAGLPPLDSLGNLSFFTIFYGRYQSGILIIAVIMVVAVNESTIDSYQNGMLSSIYTVIIYAESQKKAKRMAVLQGGNKAGTIDWKSQLWGGQTVNNSKDLAQKNAEGSSRGKNNDNSVRIQAVRGNRQEQDQPKQRESSLINDSKQAMIDTQTDPQPHNQTQVEQQQQEQHKNQQQKVQQKKIGQKQNDKPQDSKQTSPTTYQNFKQNLVQIKSTFWYRMIIILINVIMIPIAVQKIQLQVILIIIYNLCYIFVTPILFGIFVSNKYYPTLSMLISCGFCFISMHVFAIIRVKEYYPVYQGKLVFQYVWIDQGILGIDWLVNLAPFLTGIIASTILTIIAIIIHKCQGTFSNGPDKTKKGALYRELFCWVNDDE